MYSRVFASYLNSSSFFFFFMFRADKTSVVLIVVSAYRYTNVFPRSLVVYENRIKSPTFCVFNIIVDRPVYTVSTAKDVTNRARGGDFDIIDHYRHSNFRRGDIIQKSYYYHYW